MDTAVPKQTHRPLLGFSVILRNHLITSTTTRNYVHVA